MKRHSIVGPLVLIAVGAAFLMNNLHPELNLFSLAATYWPFLLIGLGTLRLVEVLFYAAQSKPLPSGGIGGGEILLIILLCIVGTGVFEARRHAGLFRLGRHTMEIFGEPFDYPVERQKAVGAKPRILFDNTLGNVRINGGDGGDLKITGHKTIRAYSQAEADKANEQSPLEVIVEGDRVIVRTNQQKVSGDRHLTTDMDVTVPRGASIEGRGRLGDFDITGIDGDVEISSDNAGVRLNKIGGNAKVDVKRSDIVRAAGVKGMVEVLGGGNDLEVEDIDGPVSVQGAFAGNLEFKNLSKPLHFVSRNTDLRVEKAPGRISMDLAALSGVNLVGPVTLTTKSKDVKLREFTQSLQLDLERGDVELEPHNLPLAKIDVRCRNGGNIDLALPADGKFDLTATTEKGEVRNDYGASVKIETSGRSSIMKMSGAGSSIQAFTARGTLTVRKE